MQNAIIDTNALIDGIDLFQFDKVWLVATVVEELDHLKSDKNEARAKSAKEAIKKLRFAYESGKIEFRTKYSVAFELDTSIPDNRILAYSKEITSFDKDAILISADNGVILKASCLKIPCKYYSHEESSVGKLYTGFFEFTGTTEEVIDFFQDIKDGINKHNLIENQYVIVNQSGNKTSEYKYVNGKLTRLKLPVIPGLEPLNSEQRCTFDLVLDKNIPVKIIAGCPGSGKTMLSTRLGLYMVKVTGDYGKLLMLRNPIGSGEDPGSLPGDLDDKCGPFWLSIQQHMDSMEMVFKKKNGNSDREYIKNQVEQNIPYFMKGMSYGSTFVMFDEAEDADLKLLRLVGSRIEQDSCVVFTGDYRQAEGKFVSNNGLLQLIERFKGNPLVGITVLSEDVRSEASKLFGTL